MCVLQQAEVTAVSANKVDLSVVNAQINAAKAYTAAGLEGHTRRLQQPLHITPYSGDRTHFSELLLTSIGS